MKQSALKLATFCRLAGRHAWQTPRKAPAVSAYTFLNMSPSVSLSADLTLMATRVCLVSVNVVNMIYLYAVRCILALAQA